VQGVGLPSVRWHRLASVLGVGGLGAKNTHPVSCLELEGEKRGALSSFLSARSRRRPSHRRLDRLEQQWVCQPWLSARFRVPDPGRPPQRVKSHRSACAVWPPAHLPGGAASIPSAALRLMPSPAAPTAEPASAFLRALPFERAPHVAGPPFSSCLPARVNTPIPPTPLSRPDRAARLRPPPEV